MKDLILKAFLDVRDGKSADAVIADPMLNAKFIERCRAVGAVESPVTLNHCLYNLRKMRALEEYPTTSRIRPKNQDEYRFASEIAARHLELRERTTLDRIICDPVLAAEFDKIAEDIAPGFTIFEYRFAALSLRKRSGLKPEIVSRVIKATEVKVFRASEVDINVPSSAQGIYILFYKDAGVLYVGEATSLRNRLRKHLDHSDRKDVARWLWDHGLDDLHIEIHILPVHTSTMERKAVERELIRSRRPRFNISGLDAKVY